VRLTPLAVTLVCLGLLSLRLDWIAVVQTLGAADGRLVLLAATLTLTHLGLRAVRWRLMLGREAPPLGVLVWSYTLGVAAGLAVPGSGELARAVLLGRRSGLRTSYVLGSVAVEKLLDSGVVLALLVVGLWRLARVGWLGPAVGAAAVVLLGVALALAAAVAWVPRGGLLAAPGWLPVRLARIWLAVSVALAERWTRFASGVAAVLRLPRGYQVGVGALTLLVWANACLLTTVALAAFELPADWALAAVLYGALLLGLSAVPAAPAALGPFELVTVAVLEGVGLPLAPSAAFAVGFHAITFAPPLAAGAVAACARGRFGR
jgi:uncharacterized membrane protein YbhN (UPF0104 family)